MSLQNHMVEPEELMAYLDGELPPDSAADTASHLEHCRECQKLAADLREVSQMMMTWEVEAPELEFTEDLDQALEKKGPGKASRQRAGWSTLNPLRWLKPLWGLAAAVLIAALVLTPTLLRRSAFQFRSVMDGPAPAPQPQKAERAPAKVPAPPLRAATPVPGKGSAEDLQDEIEGQEGEETGTSAPAVNGPMIIRTAEVEVTTKDFDRARPGIEQILKRRHGYVAELNLSTPAGEARSLTGTLRVPANQLEATMADIEGLGTTENESLGGEEVTQQYVNLQARLANAKHTEQRLTDILRERTGKLSDVLAVEMQISRVRGEIEQMEAQRKNMNNQVDFATLTLTVTEEYKEQLKAVPPSTGRQFRNAAVEGYRSLVDGIISILLWLLAVGPTLLVWAAILFFPVRMIWKRLRPRFAK